MRPRRKSEAAGVEVSDWHNSWPSSVPTINTWATISVKKAKEENCIHDLMVNKRPISWPCDAIRKLVWVGTIQWAEVRQEREQSTSLYYGQPGLHCLRSDTGHYEQTLSHIYNTGWQQGNERQQHYRISGSIYCCIEFQYHITIRTRYYWCSFCIARKEHQLIATCHFRS